MFIRCYILPYIAHQCKLCMGEESNTDSSIMEADCVVVDDVLYTDVMVLSIGNANTIAITITYYY